MIMLSIAAIAATILFADPPPPCCSSPASLVDPSRPAAPPTPTADYDVRSIRGWKVLVNPAIEAENPALLAATLEELDHQLYMITRVLPKPSLDRIRDIEIWVELDMPKTACMCYHVSKDWLIPNGYNPDKEGTVEIGNAQAFLEWTKGQPWMVLHELAHGYHDQVFGYEDPEIIAAFERSRDDGYYDKVGHISGKPRRHYALTNQMEWFAETTEALYGTNDFHPYVRSELREVDPQGARVVRQLWELDPIPTPAR
ncbi:MAG: hypothetical protein P8J59_00425 [Phycisphaerales bacterium]|nr:hypothetical protein [Phycisphaerales bacterium]